MGAALGAVGQSTTLRRACTVALAAGLAAGASFLALRSVSAGSGSEHGAATVALLAPHAELVVRDLVHGGTRVLPSGDGPGAATPSWSPDGRRIAFTLQRCASCAPQLALLRPDGGALRTLPLPESKRAAGPAAWSPNGRLLLLTAADELGETELVVVALDGRKPREVPGTDDAGEAAWSPDGTKIVFSREVGEQHRLFLADPEGHVLRTLTGTAFSAASPEWSPDGRWIAFARLDRTFTWDVCLLAVGSGRTRCISRGRANEREPAWSPSGRELFFSGDRGGGTAGRRSLYRVDALSGRTRVVTGTNVDASAPAWSPDGKSLAFVRRALIGAR